MARDQRTTGRNRPDLAEENRRLRRAIDELTVLNDLASAIGASLDAEEIMRTIVSRSSAAVGAEQGAITLLEDDPHDKRTLVRATVSSAERPPIHLRECVAGWMCLHRSPLLVNSPTDDERFAGVAWDPSVENLLCVPLLVKSRLIGALAVYNSRDGEFSEDDQRLLSIVASQSAQVIENARLYEEEKALERVERELELAAEIQRDLLPQEPPAVPGYDLAGLTVPARAVGGDYYDFIRMDEERLAVCLGDVSGKGLPAALLMASLQATVRGHALSSRSPARCLEFANLLLHEHTDPSKFVTMFCGVLDRATHVLTYAIAGHERPIVVSSNGDVRRLSESGIVLGFSDGAEYRDVGITLRPGDTVVLYSDGVTDATADDESPFGDERLVSLIEESAGESARGMIGRIVEAVSDHARGHEQFDDLTLVVCRRLPDEGDTGAS